MPNLRLTRFHVGIFIVLLSFLVLGYVLLVVPGLDLSWPDKLARGYIGVWGWFILFCAGIATAGNRSLLG